MNVGITSLAWPQAALTVLRIGSVRFTAFYFLAFYSALLAVRGGQWSPLWVALGLPIGLVNCLGIELANRWTDIKEDEINNPVRTALCRRVGYEVIGYLAVALYAVQIPVFVVWHLIAPNPALLLVQILSWLIGWNYSLGLRFKARRYGVLLILAATFVLPFLWGWLLDGSGGPLPPWGAVCMPIFVFSLAGVKDITDQAGDEVVGYRSLFRGLFSGRVRRRFLLLLVSPYAFAAALAVTGLAPLRLLALLGLMPLSLAFATLARATGGGRQAFATRELMYQLWLAFMSALVLLLFPYLAVAVLVATVWLGWLLATRWLHWHAGLDRNDLRTLVALWRQQSSPQRSSINLSEA